MAKIKTKKQEEPKQIPTQADSLALYNNSKQVQDYYKNKKYSNVGTFFNKQKVNPKYFSDKLDKGFSSFQHSNHRPGTVVPVNNSTRSKTITIPENMFRKVIDKNKLYQRENANFILDTRAPMQLYDKRIAPTQSSSFSNDDKNDPMYADYVGIDTYDPILIKPVSMLTPAEKELRIKRYGKNSGLLQQVSKPIQINQKIEDKPSSTPLSLMENPKAQLKHADVKVEAPKVEKTKYSINYRDDNSETGQSAIYFKTKQEYKDALNKAMKGKGFAGSSEDKQSASALFYNKPNINGKD